MVVSREVGGNAVASQSICMRMCQIPQHCYWNFYLHGDCSCKRAFNSSAAVLYAVTSRKTILHKNSDYAQNTNEKGRKKCLIFSPGSYCFVRWNIIILNPYFKEVYYQLQAVCVKKIQNIDRNLEEKRLYWPNTRPLDLHSSLLWSPVKF